jgi:hypothetical protein
MAPELPESPNQHGALGRKECQAAEALGWRFSDQMTRVANGWMTLAYHEATETWRPALLADPFDHPELWPEVAAAADSAQPELPL